MAVPSTQGPCTVNILPRENQIETIAALTEGVSVRAAERLTGVNRGTAFIKGRPLADRVKEATQPQPTKQQPPFQKKRAKRP